ncbi:MAG: phytanoyl-CoA dioxygenase family protein [Acidimicrobiales bacterium]
MVSDDAVAAFARDGVVVVRGLVTPEELASVADVLDHLASEHLLAGHTSQPGVVEAYCRWGEIDALAKVALRSAVPRAAAELMDSPSARFFHDRLLVVEPDPQRPTPWRQDQPYFGVHGRGISAWIPADRVPKKGSPEFWAGSHLGPWRLPPELMERAGRFFPEGTVAEIPDIDDDRSRYDIRRWDLDPGDVIFYDFAAVHTAPGRAIDIRRRVLALRYLSADARYVRRPWPTVPEFPGLDGELTEGEELDHPYFPLAWPR